MVRLKPAVFTGTMTANTHGKILVLGGTGKTGSRVVRRLEARGLPVRVGSRSAEPPFDWEDQSTWAPALRDVTSVYVAYYPDLASPGASPTIRSFTQAAVDSGVRRMVLLAGRGEEEAEACEQHVRDSGVEWTILRAAWFAQNFGESFLVEPVLAGEVALPVGDVGEPFVDAEDIADVAVAALTEDGHAGQLYELTGPRSLTFADAIGEIATATGRPIRFVPVSVDEYAAALTQHGVPPEYIQLLTYLFTTVLDGRNTHVVNDVERVLGRPARDVSAYVRAAAEAGIWAAE
ncbi:NAD(P)H-binding protein [Actinopolymorpha alba]|uniref:NAD(P)H-binding protein n=1 Tax=Actinopolymorpha alba TaxID=533267 RepID=UPI0003690E7B|nr:NAD(P)H-binding protein [Actinopolymorpha alba]